MRILLISAEPMRSGQASGTHITEIVKALSALGHEIVTCVTRVTGPYESISLVPRLIAYTAYHLQVLLRLRHADVVYARAHPANALIAFVSWVARVPIIQEINGAYWDVFITHRYLTSLAGAIIAMYRFQYRKASALLTVTAGLADWARGEAPGVPVHVVANGVNPDIFNPGRPPAAGICRDYALFFGSLTRWHGLETMILAAENEAWPCDLDLKVIGEGQLAPLIRQAADRNPRIQILSAVTQEVLSGYITRARVGLVPINALGERGRFGLAPLKLYEMLAGGLPVVVTDFPGQAELVRSLDAGLVIPPDNPAALAEAVAALHKTPPSHDKTLAVAAFMKTNHSWTNRATEIDRILSGIVPPRRFRPC